jgi:hypothetical protein
MSDWMDNPVRDDAGLRAILREAKTVVGTAVDLSVPVDVVEILRRPEYLPGHAREIRALPWRPKAVWFQLGIRHDAAAAPLARAGIRVVQDRCMMPEHRRLLAPPELVGSSRACPGPVRASYGLRRRSGGSNERHCPEPALSVSLSPWRGSSGTAGERRSSSPMSACSTLSVSIPRWRVSVCRRSGTR